MDLVATATVSTLPCKAYDKVGADRKLRLALLGFINIFLNIFPEIILQDSQISAAFFKSLCEGDIVKDHKENYFGSHKFIVILTCKCNSFLENCRSFS